MIILDTDVFTLLVRPATRERFPILMERVAQNRDAVYITAITAEEVLRGALALIRKEETRGKGTEGYHLIVLLVKELSRYPILPYTEDTDIIYRSFSSAVKRNGSADCKIAAVAYSNGATIITRNIRHFSQIPDIRYEDWTA